MGKLTYSYRLIAEFIRFAKERRVYWFVPLMVVLALSGVLIVASHAIAPFIYTLF